MYTDFEFDSTEITTYQKFRSRFATDWTYDATIYYIDRRNKEVSCVIEDFGIYKYKNCSIINNKNWECTISNGTRTGLAHGKRFYYDPSSAPLTEVIPITKSDFVSAVVCKNNLDLTCPFKLIAYEWFSKK